MEMRFPVVEGYAFALRKNLIRCDVDGMPVLDIEPNREPTATFVRPTVGYAEGSPSAHSSPFPFDEQNREEYYRETHLQTIEFQIARLIVDQLTVAGADANGSAAARAGAAIATSAFPAGVPVRGRICAAEGELPELPSVRVGPGEVRPADGGAAAGRHRAG